jgi:hypothetical protein
MKRLMLMAMLASIIAGGTINAQDKRLDNPVIIGGANNAYTKMLDKSVTVMKETELKIECGGCLVYWQPLYCIYPGNGYRLEVKNGSLLGNKPARSYSVNLGGSKVLSGPGKDDPEGKREAKVFLDGRTVLRVLLRGAVGDGITMRIYCEAGQVNPYERIVGAGNIHQAFSQSRLSGAEQPPLLPAVSLQADKMAITIGQAVKLTWNSTNTRETKFSLGDLGEVEAGGSAQVWPEQDTLFRVEAQGGGETATAEIAVTVAVPDPELELDAEPKTIYDDETTTIIWKTRNARLVRNGEGNYSYLPLSGKLKFKPMEYMPIVLVAENGQKKIKKSVQIKIINREEERQRIEEEKAKRIIPPEIDKALQGIWTGLKAAMQAGDAEKAAGFFCQESRAKYLAIYTELKEKLPQVGAEMREIKFVEFLGDGAQYITLRKETIQGKEYEIGYDVYFVLDLDGQWRIYRF